MTDRTRSRFVSYCVLVAALLRQGPALAAPSTAAESGTSAARGELALAEALFEEAKQAMDRGELAVACSKFEESLRLDLAGGTQLALAVCYERSERWASAWHAYRAALALAERDGRKDRELIAEERLGVLEPKLSRIAVSVPAPVAALRGIRIELAGVELRPPSWGLAVPYDGGVYELRASATGHEPWTTTVALRASGHQQAVEVPLLEPAAPVSAPPIPGALRVPPRPPRSAAPTDSREADTPMPIQSQLAIVFACAAAAAALPGVYFGGRALARAEVVDDACAGDTCPRSVQHDHGAARADARRADVLIGAALLAAGVSAYFLFTTPERRARASASALRPPALRLEF